MWNNNDLKYSVCLYDCQDLFVRVLFYIYVTNPEPMEEPDLKKFQWQKFQYQRQAAEVSRFETNVRYLKCIYLWFNLKPLFNSNMWLRFPGIEKFVINMNTSIFPDLKKWCQFILAQP